MTSLEILLTPNCEISIDVFCSKCKQDFSTELDINHSTDELPLSVEDILYCHNCEKVFRYTATTNREKFAISFKNDEISASLNCSKTIFLDEFETISPTRSRDFYLMQIDRLKKILGLESGEFIVEQSLNRLVFSGTITSMETYLNEILMYVVFYSDNTLQKFVENYEPYKKESLTLNEIFKKREQIESRIKEDLNNLLYHNISKLISIFNIFDFELAKFEELKNLATNIQLRHNFVHRSGIDRDDNFILVSKEQVLLLMDCTNSLIEFINKKMDEKCFTDELDFLF